MRRLQHGNAGTFILFDRLGWQSRIGNDAADLLQG